MLLPMSRQPQPETEGLRTPTGTGGGNRGQAGTELIKRAQPLRKQNPEREFNSGISRSSLENTVGAKANSLAGGQLEVDSVILQLSYVYADSAPGSHDA